MHAKSQMQNYKYSHLVQMRTSSSISRCEIGNTSEPLRVTLFYENPDRHRQESTLTHFFVYDSGERASHKNKQSPYCRPGGHVVKHGLDWTRKTWTGLEKHGLSPGFVKHGLSQSLICKTWTESMIRKT